MATLTSEQRKLLENVIGEARSVAERAARAALEALAVHHHEYYSTMSAEQRELRNRLRAHARQLGDKRDPKTEKQEIDRLVHECAYEHWHRMLFGRFLAENGLLRDPEHNVELSLDECREIAKEQGVNPWSLVSKSAQRMLPEIFKVDDPVLSVSLASNDQQQLEEKILAIPAEVFRASDSLGWVYQFWQSKKKDEVNASGNKIGAIELPAVTQLFTEDYMVDFLLDNTLGAWHAGKILAANPRLAENAQTEDELRQAVALPGCSWNYLRFIKGKDSKWAPAAGTFEGWPKTAKELTCLDPCMGSGHFVVAMFERLVALRRAEEHLAETEAVTAVIRDNVFGLEIDQRCTQISAFNLALAAWRHVGYCALPAMNLACSGLAPNAREADWLKIAGKDPKLQRGMERLYQLFQKATVLGSLIDPRTSDGDLLVAGFHEIRPLLERALAQEAEDDITHEMVVTARGLAKAADILSGQFTLVATNVPYLKSSKHDAVLKEFCERVYPKTKTDLATIFIERCIQFCTNGGSTTLVSPQTWLFLGAFTNFRKDCLAHEQWNFLARLGSGAFGTISGEVVNVALMTLSSKSPPVTHAISGIDADSGHTPELKAQLLREALVQELPQASQLKNPDARFSFGELGNASLLQVHSDAYIGQRTGDGSRFISCYWEFPDINNGWVFFGTTVEQTCAHGGLQHILLWEDGKGQLAEYQARLAETVYASGGWKQGWQAWGKFGVRVSQMGDLPVTLHSGSHFDNNCAVIVPKRSEHLSAIWAFCESPDFRKLVRQIDQSIKVTNATLVKIPFDLDHWQKVADEKYPHGLPKPFSSDPTQWLFDGRLHTADQPLHVAMARLLGYQWPRQTGTGFPDCPALKPDNLVELADDDGIVPISPIKGEASAAERLREVLARAYGKDWSASRQEELLAQVECAGASLEDWIRNGFFEQHCALFHQRPFVWHIWDGLKNGFGALVNYHKLSAPNGEGRRTLDTLIYSYLGDWINRQKPDQATGVEGADAKLAAAIHLKGELEKIRDGEPPYDVFVRWKPLHRQSIGWEPDINDGVRMNIRPFMTAKPLNARGASACILRTTPKIKWEKDRGKEVERAKEDFPWFWNGNTFQGDRVNDIHLTNAEKEAARKRHQEHSGGKK